jgi:hypothetical protein
LELSSFFVSYMIFVGHVSFQLHYFPVIKCGFLSWWGILIFTLWSLAWYNASDR